jgi:hypothetical protein
MGGERGRYSTAVDNDNGQTQKKNETKRKNTQRSRPTYPAMSESESCELRFCAADVRNASARRDWRFSRSCFTSAESKERFCSSAANSSRVLCSKKEGATCARVGSCAGANGCTVA